MDIGRVTRIKRILDVVRYGFPSGTNLLYIERKSRIKTEENRTNRVKPVSELSMAGYTRDATRRNIDESGGLFNRHF